MKKNIKILFAAYECAPFYKVGGLGDVAGSLPKFLAKIGVDIRIALPFYKKIKDNYHGFRKIKEQGVSVAGQKTVVSIFEGRLPGSSVPVYFIDNENFEAIDIFDEQNRFRFTFFSYLIATLPEIIGWQPDIFHLNDWHTGLVPPFLKRKNSQAKTIFTIHNLAYTGDTPLKNLKQFGFSKEDFSQVDKNMVNIMREAILKSDFVTTVSPTYAKEILTPELACGLEKALGQKKKFLSGVINGLDYSVFDPVTDRQISFPYSIENLNEKTKNKLYLQKISGLKVDPRIPIFGMISRLAGQKGFDILEKSFDKLMGLNLQLVILGTGEKKYELLFNELRKKHPDKFKFYNLFDTRLASQIYAGADIFLMPSFYEPCGLGQLIAMRYGTLPVARATGGLKDTIAPVRKINFRPANGFLFRGYDSASLIGAVRQSLICYHQPKRWRQLQINAMKADFSWGNSALKYFNLYQRVVFG
ncbi:glycogen synthase [Candidatus Kuenenbacteria bacterium]|nr:glycogen synthase [Candidatus Kuenenbacteria bacterium]